MQLVFEHTQPLGAGTNPACAHFATNTAQVFYINDGKLYAISTDTPLGNWDNRVFSAPVKAAEDENITHMSLKNFPRYGLYGTWWSDDRHRFAIYEFEIIMSEYVEEGSISSRIDDPVVGINLRLANPDESFIGEDEGILAPGARLYFAFRAGDSEPYDMCIAYVDRSKYDVTTAEVQVSGRNTIGKVLKDATFDEYNQYPKENFTSLLQKLFANAGIPADKLLIDTAVDDRGMNFPPDMSFLDGIQALIGTTINWKIAELPDGTIVMGPNYYDKLPQPGKYTFYRDKDIFSRTVSRDDAETYARVCVRCETTGTGTGTVTASALNVRPEPNTSKPPIASLPNGTQVEVLLESGNGWLQIRSGEITGYVSGQYVQWTKGTQSQIFSYADVPYFEGWGLAKQKTLYVDAPNGTTQEELDSLALQLADRVGMSGVIESFTGPFRPHIQNGDEAEIISSTGTRLLGLITEVTHSFGKSGFRTDFTCESSGRIGKGMLKDFIGKIAGKKQTPSGVTRLY
jgi:uncharacterized protein YgiM (DUF1202 family)